MTKATLIIGATVITLLFMFTGSFAGNFRIHKRINIIGATVSNTQGEKLGAISDIAFDKDTGKIAYVILSYEGTTGSGEKLITVPLSALRFINEKNAKIDISKEKLASAYSFEKANLPDMKDKPLIIDTQKIYSMVPH